MSSAHDDYAHAMKEVDGRIEALRAERRDLYAQWQAIGFLAQLLGQYARRERDDVELRWSVAMGEPAPFRNRWRSYRRERHGRQMMDLGTPLGIVVRLRRVDQGIEEARAERSRLYRSRPRKLQQCSFN